MAATKRIDVLWGLLQRWADEGCRSIAAETGRGDGESASFAAGTLSATDGASVTADSIFLIASPTKPLVATAAMMLVEQGRLQLDHRVQRYLPEFRGGGKEDVRLIHLLTHTSGLPDMLPNNVALRQAHAPLAEFMRHVNDVELHFEPGTRVHYQSMGLLTLATVMESVAEVAVPDLLQQQIFAPLGMRDTALGIPAAWRSSDHSARLTASQVEGQEGADDWGWNSDYWRELGAPWGGLLSTAADWGKLARHLLGIHAGGDGVVSPSTLRAMTTNQLGRMAGIPSATARATPWGLGWQLNWPGHPRGFGELLPAAAYGHWGATGTMIWIDPTRDAYGVVLTTEPIAAEDRRQIAFGNLSSAVWG
ncbi:MAG: serine hydrolase domain-containing protein [Pirellulaceae bacterium]|nr:serine hydrolase domain-containing protein [Pirellulaceae bacterium]MDP7015123.1 serine hydrolase domain-containing protein [Pirellulaceae bacterium]